MASAKYWLSAIRGLLGLVVAIQLLVVAYLIQTALQSFIMAGTTIPTTMIPLLNALQITVGLTFAAAFLLIAGLGRPLDGSR